LSGFRAGAFNNLSLGYIGLTFPASLFIIVGAFMLLYSNISRAAWPERNSRQGRFKAPGSSAGLSTSHHRLRRISPVMKVDGWVQIIPVKSYLLHNYPSGYVPNKE